MTPMSGDVPSGRALRVLSVVILALLILGAVLLFRLVGPQKP